MHKAIGIPGVALTMFAAGSDAASSAGAMDAAIAERASSGRPQPPASRTGSPDLNPDGVLDRLQTQDRLQDQVAIKRRTVTPYRTRTPSRIRIAIAL